MRALGWLLGVIGGGMVTLAILGMGVVRASPGQVSGFGPGAYHVLLLGGVVLGAACVGMLRNNGSEPRGPRPAVPQLVLD